MSLSPIYNRYVPTISFDTLVYAAPMRALGDDFYFTYEGPSQFLEQIASAVGPLGDILPIDPPSANASWTSASNGPAIRCDPLPVGERHTQIDQNIMDYINSSDHCARASAYITWVGDLPYSRDFSVTALNDTEATFVPSGQTLSYTHPEFYVAVLPVLMTQGIFHVCEFGFHEDPANPQDVYDFNVTMLQCQLVNSTYHVSFDYVNGNQTVRIDVPLTPEEKFMTTIDRVAGPVNESCVFLHTGHYHEPGGYAVPNDCIIEKSLPQQQLAYQSILDAFFSIVSGPIDQYPTIVGNVISTTLLETEELSFATDFSRALQRSDGTWWNLQASLVASNQTDIAGIIITPDPAETRLPLARGLEEMFQNFTVSLLSSSAFR